MAGAGWGAVVLPRAANSKGAEHAMRLLLRLGCLPAAGSAADFA